MRKSEGRNVCHVWPCSWNTGLLVLVFLSSVIVPAHLDCVQLSLITIPLIVYYIYSIQPSLTVIRDTVTSFNLFICDMGHEISTFFLSPSTIFKLMYFNWKYFLCFCLFRLFNFSLNT